MNRRWNLARASGLVILLAGCAAPAPPPAPPPAPLLPTPQVVTPTVVSEAAEKPTPLQQMDLLLARFAEEEGKRKVLEKAIADRDERLGALQRRLSELEAELGRREGEMAGLSGRNQDLAGRVAALETQIHSFDEERRVLAGRFALERLERLTLEKELLEREIAERTWKDGERP